MELSNVILSIFQCFIAVFSIALIAKNTFKKNSITFTKTIVKRLTVTVFLQVIGTIALIEAIYLWINQTFPSLQWVLYKMPVIKSASGFVEIYKAVLSIGLVLAMFSVPKVLHEGIVKDFSVSTVNKILVRALLIVLLVILFGGPIALGIIFFLSVLVIFAIFQDKYTENKELDANRSGSTYYLSECKQLASLYLTTYLTIAYWILCIYLLFNVFYS